MLVNKILSLSSLSIIGMEKNAGKTTALNYILEEARKRGNNRTFALTSIGRDGEQKDMVTSTHKPRIYVEAGTLIATAKDMIKRGDVTKEIIESTDITSAIGNIVLFRALSDGYVEIAGPSSVSGSAKVKDLFFNVDPDCIFIVDGALSRKSTAGHFLSDAALLATGASVGRNIYNVVEKTVHVVNLFALKKVSENIRKIVNNTAEDEHIVLFGDKIKKVKTKVAFSTAKELSEIMDDSIHTICIKGALTQKFVFDLSTYVDLKGRTIVAQDATRIIIDHKSYAKFKMMGIHFAVLDEIEIIGITINPFSPRGTDFDSSKFEHMLKEHVSIPVIDVLREKGC
ncbi:MAG: hypothetical protein CSB16_00200 [Clostridiales bacterium]|nr:MAG: hypothetical protein CSB16_00200 [Clostridiales bacterium]